MSDPDRGAYTPQTDAPLSFDARQPRGGGGGGGGPPTTLIVSGVLLVVLIIGIFMFYKSGIRGANEPPQPAGESIGEMKTVAPPSQPADPAAGLDVYKAGEGAAPTAPAFAPGPETPMPRPVPRPTLKVQTGELPPIDEQPGPPPVAARPPPAPTPAPVAAQPKAAPPAPKAAPAPAPAPTPAPAPAATGGAAVQIGAFSSEALASKGLSDVAAAYPGGSRGRRIEPVKTGAATLYRGLLTGFASHEAAVAYCAKLKAAGKSCIVR